MLCTGFLQLNGGYPSLKSAGFSSRWRLVAEQWHTGFSSCSTEAQQLWLASPRALWFWGPCRTRTRTHVPDTGRLIVIHYAAREVLQGSLFTLRFLGGGTRVIQIPPPLSAVSSSRNRAPSASLAVFLPTFRSCHPPGKYLLPASVRTSLPEAFRSLSGRWIPCTLLPRFPEGDKSQLRGHAQL